jgi:hypothetical protein
MHLTSKASLTKTFYNSCSCILYILHQQSHFALKPCNDRTVSVGICLWHLMQPMYYYLHCRALVSQTSVGYNKMERWPKDNRWFGGWGEPVRACWGGWWEFWKCGDEFGTGWTGVSEGYLNTVNDVRSQPWSDDLVAQQPMRLGTEEAQAARQVRRLQRANDGDFHMAFLGSRFSLLAGTLNKDLAPI